MSELDICPQCGTDLEGAPGVGGRSLAEPLPEANQQRECPNCGKTLRRAAGGAWHLSEEADLDPE